MKYYRRFRPDNTPFYIDERGNVVDEKTAKTNLQEKATHSKPKTRIMESLAEFDALLAPIANYRRGAPVSQSKFVEAWRAIGLSEEAARIAARVETDMRKSVKDWTTEDWAKFSWPT